MTEEGEKARENWEADERRQLREEKCGREGRWWWREERQKRESEGERQMRESEGERQRREREGERQMRGGREGESRDRKSVV